MKEVLHCTQPECTFKTKNSIFSRQELGRHLKFVHGIAGNSGSAKSQQAKKTAILEAEIEESTDKYHKAILEESRRVLDNGKPPRERKQYTTNAEIQAAYYAGKIAVYCETEAEKLGVPKEQFTRKVSELFFANQMR